MVVSFMIYCPPLSVPRGTRLEVLARAAACSLGMHSTSGPLGRRGIRAVDGNGSAESRNEGLVIGARRCSTALATVLDKIAERRPLCQGLFGERKLSIFPGQERGGSDSK
jgi:hypothetical protein